PAPLVKLMLPPAAVVLTVPLLDKVPPFTAIVTVLSEDRVNPADTVVLFVVDVFSGAPVTLREADVALPPKSKDSVVPAAGVKETPFAPAPATIVAAAGPAEPKETWITLALLAIDGATAWIPPAVETEEPSLNCKVEALRLTVRPSFTLIAPFTTTVLPANV